MDELCEQMNHYTMNLNASFHFLKDYNLIIESVIFKIQEHFYQYQSNYELENSISHNKLPQLDIYDILVSCGHALTWSMEYIVSDNDIQWLKTKGRSHFFNEISKYFDVNNNSNYYTLLPCYLKLVELFELQIN